MASEVGRLRRDGVPMFLLITGDVFFGTADPHKHESAPSSALQDTWRAETLVEILNRLQVQAIHPGAADWNHDRALTTALLSKINGRSLAALPPDGPRTTSELLESDGIKIGLIGIANDTGSLDDDTRSSVTASARELRAAGALLVIALASSERRVANQLGRIAGVDFVVSAGIDTKQATPPAETGPAHVLTGGRQGEGLLVLDVYRVTDGPFADASPWSRQRDSEAAAQSIQELKTRIAQWEQQPEVDRAAVEQQRARLAELERQAASAEQVSAGNRFVASWREIGPEVTREPSVEALIDAYDRRVNEHNHVALADKQAPPAAPGQPHYVGAAACQSCHQKAYAWWTEHPHGHAYATLQEVNKEFHLGCVGCHVTGYEKPGGSAVVQNAGLTNVGCESCHGPGSQHVDDPDAEPYSVQRNVPEPVCVSCHNAEHSDKFDYAKYAARLLVPGHGRPVVTPTVTP